MHPTVIAADSNSFFKDGRKISVGDCALFKPPQDSPPFIGLIRWLTSRKDNNLHLGVNWLYRPAELKLGKGSLLDSAPNEIFYSFHKDEIPAASVLHPCKVAFLPRGAELPTGTSSFVCRRVYDIENKCLWWLTDQDYINDGRKISIGDCALFKPPQDSPPFIGLIRWLTSRKDNNLHLGVNWLYRPAELKLGKGSLLDSAPNEIFYSFHKDEIPAASVLHPCKVAFLPRGAELPTGTSSFVCRRVYDIENKCLCLVVVPKQVNGPNSLSQLKPGSDHVQNSGTSFPSQIKGKKRERGDHTAEPVKRDRSSRTEDGDSAQYKAESSLKSDIARITEKGGVVDLEGVEKLVQLMQSDRAERKMDLTSRLMLAGVISATEKVECLSDLFSSEVYLYWMSGSRTSIKEKLAVVSSKDCDKSVEEFLLVLLRALEKLPVNLHALQMCNIGRSVNHLRSNKNVEIQRKARSLVDTWKKGVEAEMISIDAKSGTTQGTSVWSSKSRLTEASHAVKTPSGSDIAMKSSISQQSASKTNSIKSSHGENVTKSASSSPGPVKPASPHTSVKESQPAISVGGSPDAPTTREDRSSSSNQSHSYSQSISVKEEGRSCKISSSSRSRKGSGFPAVNAGQKENSSSRSSLPHRSTASDKLSQPALTSERVLEGPTSEACNHKLVVKIPNLVRSPTQGVSGLEDPSIMSSRTSSPGLSDKVEQFDTIPKEKSDAYRSDINVDSCQSNDRKDASRDGAASPALPDDEKSMSIEDSRRLLIEGPKKNNVKSAKLHETSFSPMNALIESCAKYSEAHSSLSLEDDVGMNLLASVATGEMSRSELVSPTDSTERSTPAVQEVSFSAKSKSSPEDQVQGCQSQFVNDAESDDKKQAALDDSSGSEDGSDLPKQASLVCPADIICDPAHTSADLPVKERTKPLDSVRDGTDADDTEDKAGKDLLDADNVNLMVKVALLNQSCAEDCKNDVNEGLEIGTNSRQKFTAVEKSSNEKLQQTAPVQSLVSEASNEVKVREMDDMDSKTPMTNAERENFGRLVDRKTAIEGNNVADSCFSSNDLKRHDMEVNIDKKEIADCSLPEGGFPVPVVHEAQKNDELRGSKAAGVEVDEAESASTVGEASSAAPASPQDSKIKFDLNEGLIFDDGKYGEPVSVIATDSTSGPTINALPFSVDPIPSCHPGSITVAAAAKGPFVPPADLLRSRVELGWKGSAATSAFRPAEPRKVIEMAMPSTNERVLEEIASRDSALALGMATDSVNKFPTLLKESSGSMPVLSSGGLDLDLNRVDEATETGQCSTSSNRIGEVRCMEHLSINQQVRVHIPSQLPSPCPRMSNPGLGSFTSWFPPGYTNSTVAIPSIIPDRADQPFPVIPPGAPQRTFGPAVFLFHLALFLLEQRHMLIPLLEQSCFAPPVNSQLLGSVGAISSQFQRPYMLSLPDSSSNGLENNRKWGRQGLDLNAGPGAVESEVREDMLPPPSSQHSVASSQALTEDQARMYSMSGSLLKRKSQMEGGIMKASDISSLHGSRNCRLLCTAAFLQVLERDKSSNIMRLHMARFVYRITPALKMFLEQLLNHHPAGILPQPRGAHQVDITCPVPDAHLFWASNYMLKLSMCMLYKLYWEDRDPYPPVYILTAGKLEHLAPGY
ncbi:hypothetical protein Sango_1616900 [Sesamum angolense]|uniref:BAH domain n=1 Tax=Sesamum angolense TaxID=2727404 RepID=A0AAE2BR12_9LAMI|nr:hypothetical protein Sango_1616900 [Sesamum angolense]